MGVIAHTFVREQRRLPDSCACFRYRTCSEWKKRGDALFKDRKMEAAITMYKAALVCALHKEDAFVIFMWVKSFYLDSGLIQVDLWWH